MANHYAPPQAKVDDVALSGQGITSEMIESLRGTKGWVLLIGICLLVSAAFTALAAIGVLFASMFGASARMGAGVGVGIALVYFFVTFIYILLGWSLVKYSSAIKRLIDSGQSYEMEEALEQQRKFWKLAGFIILVVLVLMIIGFIAALTIPALMMARGGLG